MAKSQDEGFLKTVRRMLGTAPKPNASKKETGNQRQASRKKTKRGKNSIA
jgi:hypothetical protein